MGFAVILKQGLPSPSLASAWLNRVCDQDQYLLLIFPGREFENYQRAPIP